MSDLWTEIQSRLDMLDEAIADFRDSGREYAEAEAEYKSALSNQTLRLRSESMPVTIIGDVVRGLQDVNELRMKRDIAETMYKADMESINVNKLRIRVLEAQMNREWRQ